MEKPKIIVEIKNSKVVNVYSNMREDVELEVEVYYPLYFSSY